MKLLVVVWGMTAVLWTVPEGDLQREGLFAVFTVFTGLTHFFRRYMAGRRLPAWQGLAIPALWGFLLGAGSVLMTLFLMAVKTGLHAHGPEFSAAEVSEVWRRLPLWSLAGTIGGLGLGLLLLTRSSETM
jgi:hypothetical protein